MGHRDFDPPSKHASTAPKLSNPSSTPSQRVGLAYRPLYSLLDAWAMDLSSDPFHDPLGSSPPPTEPMDTGVEARACPNPTPPTLPTIPMSRVGLGLSSSPDFTLDSPFSSGGLSASTHRPTQQPHKRGL